MPSIFSFLDYRVYLAAWIESQGASAYGMKGRIAEALGVSSSLVSQALSGLKGFTADQTSDLCDFIGLSEMEAEYLHLLVERDRAGSALYRAKLDRKIEAMKREAGKIGKRVPRHKELSDEQRAIYYSSWLYTGARNALAIPGCDSVDALAKKLAVEPPVAARVVRFLLENGLAREENGRLAVGPASVHVDRDSPFVNKHHQNWRLQGLRAMERGREQDLFFTSPMSLSRDAAAEIQALLPELVSRALKIAGPSPSETAVCLSIDWFRYSER